jgi:hypothetical protein
MKPANLAKHGFDINKAKTAIRYLFIDYVK